MDFGPLGFILLVGLGSWAGGFLWWVGVFSARKLISRMLEASA